MCKAEKFLGRAAIGLIISAILVKFGNEFLRFGNACFIVYGIYSSNREGGVASPLLYRIKALLEKNFWRPFN